MELAEPVSLLRLLTRVLARESHLPGAPCTTWRQGPSSQAIHCLCNTKAGPGKYCAVLSLLSLEKLNGLPFSLQEGMFQFRGNDYKPRMLGACPILKHFSVRGKRAVLKQKPGLPLSRPHIYTLSRWPKESEEKALPERTQGFLDLDVTWGSIRAWRRTTKDRVECSSPAGVDLAKAHSSRPGQWISFLWGVSLLAASFLLALSFHFWTPSLATWATVNAPASRGPSYLCNGLSGWSQAPLWVGLHLWRQAWAVHPISTVKADVQEGETRSNLIYSTAEKPFYHRRWRNVYTDYLGTCLWPSANHFVTFNLSNCKPEWVTLIPSFTYSLFPELLCGSWLCVEVSWWNKSCLKSLGEAPSKIIDRKKKITKAASISKEKVFT